MADKTTKVQTVQVAVTRSRPFPAKVIVSTAFSLRFDAHLGVVDVRFEGSGQLGERVFLDPTILQGNLAVLKTYIARMLGEADDASQKPEISAGSPSIANILHICNMGVRAETVFGLVCLGEWLDAGRHDSSKESAKVNSLDVVVVYSTRQLQKKLLLELVTLVSQQVKP